MTNQELSRTIDALADYAVRKDGNVQLSVGSGGHPFDIPGDAVPSDVVGILAEIVVP